MPEPLRDPRLLHVTNGDIVASMLSDSPLSGSVLSWKDVLHEGPVPARLSPAALRERRARWMAGRGWAPYSRILGDFAARDRRLEEASTATEIVLWFEHDLYDQLQLIQILDRLHLLETSESIRHVSLICIDRFPGPDPFFGLGQLNAVQLTSLFPHRTPVTPDQRALASHAWEAFTAPDPGQIDALLEASPAPLPFLAAALRRHCEEFPATENGLTRSERQILTSLSDGATTPSDIFTTSQSYEQAPFMGDLTLWSILIDLATGSEPLLRLSAASIPIGTPAFASQQATLSERGNAVLRGAAYYRAPDAVDRWRAGVRLSGDSKRWQWNGQRLVAGEAPGDA